MHLNELIKDFEVEGSDEGEEGAESKEGKDGEDGEESAATVLLLSLGQVQAALLEMRRQMKC